MTSTWSGVTGIIGGKSVTLIHISHMLRQRLGKAQGPAHATSVTGFSRPQLLHRLCRGSQSLGDSTGNQRYRVQATATLQRLRRGLTKAHGPAHATSVTEFPRPQLCTGCSRGSRRPRDSTGSQRSRVLAPSTCNKRYRVRATGSPRTPMTR